MLQPRVELGLEVSTRERLCHLTLTVDSTHMWSECPWSEVGIAES